MNMPNSQHIFVTEVKIKIEHLYHLDIEVSHPRLSHHKSA